MNQKANARGEVTEVLPNAQFRVDVDGKLILCHVSGKMRIHSIKLVIGDKVELYIPPQSSIARITRRL